MVAKRQSIQVPGRGRVHSPVPEGIRVGDFIFSSLLGPVGPNREQGANVAEDAALLFQRIGDLVVAGGGAPEDIVDMAVYVFDDNDRDAINREWLKMFTDPNDRPARHILNVSPHGTHWRFAMHFTAILHGVDNRPDERLDLLFSPLITGCLPHSGPLPVDPQKQAEMLFQNFKKWVESKGGTTDNIVNVMVYLKGDEYREVINKEWAKMFPDRNNLPARQTIVLASGLEVEMFGVFATALL